jgi:hypothetical protein
VFRPHHLVAVQNIDNSLEVLRLCLVLLGLRFMAQDAFFGGRY